MKKLSRINAELQKQITIIISKKLKDPRLDGLIISVTRIETDNDLTYSKVYLSILTIDKDKQEICNFIQNAAGFIRNELKKVMLIRNIPSLHFHIDDSAEYAIKIEKLLEDNK